MVSMKRPKLGQRVRIRARLVREAEANASRDYSDKKTWVREGYYDPEKPRSVPEWLVRMKSIMKEPTTIKGVYIGYRTLSNGTRRWYGDEGFVFTPEEYFEAWLVVIGERLRPVFVRPEDCEVIK